MPLLLNVITSVCEIDPVARSPKLMLDGLTESFGATPVPVIGILVVEPEALCCSTSEAERSPVAFGVKTKIIEHALPTETVAQSWVWVNSSTLAPEKDNPDTLRSAVPVLRIERVLDEEGVPINC